jgi:N-acetylmuramoyl-L-alanine amidase
MPARLSAACLALALVGAPAVPQPQPEPPIRPEASAVPTLRLASDLRVTVRQGRELELAVLAGPDDDAASVAQRVTGDASHADELLQRTGIAGVTGGLWVRVPLALLSVEYRGLVLRSLFPRDHPEGDSWVHVSRSGVLPTYDEGLWQIAEWFTGRGEAFVELMRANQLTSPETAISQIVRVPAALLHPAFTVTARSEDGALEYGDDGRGAYAAYRLKPGEALYSAVVVRFTGRTEAEDVLALVEQVCKRNGIREPRDIPAGYAVKIPLDLLDPEYLPPSDPRHQELQARRAEVKRELALHPVAPTPRDLSNVLVILDPGHGGRDLGTMSHGVWEHDYVYDVSCRLKGMLERDTAATVRMTLEDAETGCVPSKTNKLKANRQGTILTNPRFVAREEGESTIGVNLRWYLANSLYRRALGDGLRPDRVVFLSLHADSRHPGLRGAMVYVPGASYRTRSQGSNSATYRKFAEVREKPVIQFTHQELVRSEAVSRELASSIVDGFRGLGLPVQPYHPVRDKVVRGRKNWVPAVLRGNAVPAKVLVEMVNLSNASDAALLGAASDRDRLARAIERSLQRYFAEPGAAGSGVTGTR